MMYAIIISAAILVICGAFAAFAAHTAKARILVCLIGLILCGAVIAAWFFFFRTPEDNRDPWEKTLAFYDDIGTPYAEYYTDEQMNSRLAEDMVVFDGRLYVGAGDYGMNTGPLPVMSYDLKNKVWEGSEELIQDEQIKRFEIIDGSLVILGTDPKDGWSQGSYYIPYDGAWETVSALPGGVHCFDAITVGDETLFGLGVTHKNSPVVRFDGEEYTPVEFLREGVCPYFSQNEIIRVYNLFTYKGVTYAFLSLDAVDESGKKIYFMDLYAYDGESFNYVCGSLPSEDLREVAVTDSKVFFIIDNALLSSEDLVNFSATSPAADTTPIDIMNYGGNVYLLGAKPTETGGFHNAVFKLNKDGIFEIVRTFKTTSEVNSFCRDEDYFYVSLGKRDSVSETSSAGTVLKIIAE